MGGGETEGAQEEGEATSSSETRRPLSQTWHGPEVEEEDQLSAGASLRWGAGGEKKSARLTAGQKAKERRAMLLLWDGREGWIGALSNPPPPVIY